MSSDTPWVSVSLNLIRPADLIRIEDKPVYPVWIEGGADRLNTKPQQAENEDTTHRSDGLWVNWLIFAPVIETLWADRRGPGRA